MNTLDFDQLMTTCDLICKLLTNVRVGKYNTKPTLVVDNFHYELLKYAVFLADADGEISEDPPGIHRYWGTFLLGLC